MTGTDVTAPAVLKQGGHALVKTRLCAKTVTMELSRALRHAMIITATVEMAVIAHVALKQNGHALVIHQCVKGAEMVS